MVAEKVHDPSKPVKDEKDVLAAMKGGGEPDAWDGASKKGVSGSEIQKGGSRRRRAKGKSKGKSLRRKKMTMKQRQQQQRQQRQQQQRRRR
jgi:hypothetical protein